MFMKTVAVILLQTQVAQESVVETTSEVTSVISIAFEKLASWFADNLSNLIAGLLVLIVFWVIARLVRLLILAVYKKTEIDIRVKLLVSRLLAAAIFRNWNFHCDNNYRPKLRFRRFDRRTRILFIYHRLSRPRIFSITFFPEYSSCGNSHSRSGTSLSSTTTREWFRR